MRSPSRCTLVALTLAMIAAAPASAAAAETPWSIGAAKVDTTPPAFNAAQDLQDFPETTCPRAVYDAPRHWRFEEPYHDANGNGEFDYPDPSTPNTGDQYCDLNANGRWDGIFLSGGNNHQAKSVHDPIDARAVAFSGGGKTVVLVSVIAQGIFENYIREARTEAEALAGQGSHRSSCGHIDEMVVSSNHNESSPDTIGLYGPEDPSGTTAAHSGIDEYYMHWLDSRMADAAVAACDARQTASLREAEQPIPAGLRQEIPNRFPTTDDAGHFTSIDPKIRVLQAKGLDGRPIFTMMNLADHNQDIGQSDTYDVSRAISGDWPGYFHRHLEQQLGGMAMFLAADIGSMEDPITVPAIPGPPCNSGDNGCYQQVDATGGALADAVAGALAHTQPVTPGPVNGRRTEFCAPLENNLFRAVLALGIFGERQAYTGCQPTGRAGNELKTSVAVLDVGPDLQFISNPGEAFPQLMLGGPWGVEDASCANRPNPPVPTWHASARYRFQVGLGDDMIGYMKPAWAFWQDTPGSYANTDCQSDPHNHHHGLEDESVGPTASNMVATKLTELLDAHPDPTAEIRLGRYVRADGTLTPAYAGPQDQGTPGHFPTDAVAIWLANPGSTTLDADPSHANHGTLVSLDGIGAFGSRHVDASGRFMDFDGATQAGGPDVTTRGMLVSTAAGGVAKRFYVDVYPALTVTGALGASQAASTDVSITQRDSADPVTVGHAFSYVLTIANHGPDKALGVEATDDLPAGVTYDSASASQGSCSIAAKRVTCAIGALARDQIETVTIRVTPAQAGKVRNTASVSAATSDPDHSNDSSTETTQVNPAPSPPATRPCLDTAAPRSSFDRRGVRHSRPVLVLRGTSTDPGCAGSAAGHTHSTAGHLARVDIALARSVGHGMCRFLRRRGGFTSLRRCDRPRWIAAHGTNRWSFSRRGSFPAGSYVALARALDRAGNRERRRTHANTLAFRLR